MGLSFKCEMLIMHVTVNIMIASSLFYIVIPVITEPPESITVEFGANVNFSCNAAAKPRAVIMWIKNKTVLSNNSLSGGGARVIITNNPSGNCTVTDLPSHCTSSSTLKLFNSVPADSGEYICVATNVAGNDIYTANLVVDGKNVLLKCMAYTHANKINVELLVLHFLSMISEIH